MGERVERERKKGSNKKKYYENIHAYALNETQAIEWVFVKTAVATTFNNNNNLQQQERKKNKTF